MNIVYYGYESSDSFKPTKEIDGIYNCMIWKPSLFRLIPKGFPLFPYVLWSLFHYLLIFRNRDYGICIIYSRDEIVHRSLILPPYFRYPFMDKQDIQIGDVWTKKEHRGKGIAVYAIRKIIEIYNMPNRKFWYVVDNENISSIKTAEKAGLIKKGQGAKQVNMGINILSKYIILKDQKEQ